MVARRRMVVVVVVLVGRTRLGRGCGVVCMSER